MNNIKKMLINIFKIIPVLLLLGLGVWLALGIFFLFLCSGCAAPVHPEWRDISPTEEIQMAHYEVMPKRKNYD